MAGKENQPSPQKAKPLSDPDAPAFPIVGVGASAGGLETFKRFFSALPAEPGLTLVLVPHLDPNHESLMDELLQKHTPMPVLQAEEGMEVKNNHVYLIPPGSYLSIARGRLHLSEPVKYRGMRMPIDYFLRSLAEDRRLRSICIILSGTGSDGALGLKSIKELGGMAMVEDPKSAEHDGMPRNAINTGLVDFVLSVEEMPDVLIKYVRHSYVRRAQQVQELAQAEQDHLNLILSLLRARTDYDFQCYKKDTLGRRIQRRMGLRQIEQISDYVTLLQQESEEVRQLFKDLLIGVTSFFRDPAAFSALEHDVLAPLIESKKLDEPVRVWVPGCATGEEAFSLAMTLYQQFTKQTRGYNAQIFATDIDEDAIEQARAALYPRSIVSDVSEECLQLYFEEDEERYRVKKRLRETIVFAVQSLITDPPFSQLDLISCRNVLIYLEPEVQQKLIQMFHFALREGGCLFLGSAEGINKQAGLFQPISKTYRTYRRTGKPQRGQSHFPVVPASESQVPKIELPESMQGKSIPAPSSAMVSERARQTLLDAFAPASVMVNRQHQILYFHGPTTRYLDLPSGEPTTDLIAMVKEGLRSRLRAILQRAWSEANEELTTLVPRIQRHEQIVTVRITVHPVRAPKSEPPLLLISFTDEGVRKGSPATEPTPEEKEQAPAGETDTRETVAQLEYELQATREDLQSTIEELETSNEEMKASNEEVMSMNEELQSTNEELETSREELQSLNEELSTVNCQLEDKVAELEGLNNDLTNLLTSTNIPTIFLDTSLCIRRFTPGSKELLRLIPSDVGRPVSDLAPRAQDPELLTDAEQVLDKLTPIEKEVRSAGNWYVRRILPYRTSDNRIEGVVITYSDVTRTKQATHRAESRARQHAVVANLGRLALKGIDLQVLFDEAVQQIGSALEVPLARALELQPDQECLLLRSGVGWEDGLVGKATLPIGVASQSGFTLQTAGPVIVEDLASETRFSGSELLTDHEVVSGMSVVIEGRDEPFGVLSVHTREKKQFDLDDASFLQAVANVLAEAVMGRRAEELLMDREERLRLALEAGNMGTWKWNPQTNHSVWDATQERLFGLEEGSFDGNAQLFFDRVHPEDLDEAQQALSRCLEQGEDYHAEFRIHKGGELRWLVGRGKAIQNEKGDVVSVIGVNFDVTDRREATEIVRRSEEWLRLITDSLPLKIAYVDQHQRYQFNNRYQDWFEKSPEEIRGTHIRELLGEKTYSRILPHVEAALQGEPQNYEIRLRHQGKAADVLAQYVPHIVAGEVQGFFAVETDVTWLKQAKAESAILKTSEHERQRIGQDLHDSAGQMLIGMGYVAQSLVEKLADKPEQELARKLEEGLEKTRRDIRVLVRGLLPVEIDEHGLMAALEQLAEQSTSQNNARITFHCNEPIPVQNPEVASHLYHIAQEAVTNSQRHAEASHVEIRLFRRKDHLVLEIADDGIGIANEMSNEGMGFRIMQYRAKAVGAELTVENAGEKGTLVQCSLSWPGKGSGK